jgi:hypothetical protein
MAHTWRPVMTLRLDSTAGRSLNSLIGPAV